MFLTLLKKLIKVIQLKAINNNNNNNNNNKSERFNFRYDIY